MSSKRAQSIQDLTLLGLSPNRSQTRETGGGGRHARSDTSLDEQQASTHRQLYDDFETSAQSVAALYRTPTWMHFQHSAAATTRMYKSSLDALRRAHEAGVAAGRARLMKEMLATLIHPQAVVTHLGRVYVRRDELLTVLAHSRHTKPNRQHSGQQNSTNQPGATEDAMGMFRDALQPNGEQLGVFLNDQVRRHRKRARRPTPESSSPMDMSPPHTKRSKHAN